MPEPILKKYPDRIYRIPMRDTVRNLNLATAVGIVLYEAIRRLQLKLDVRSEDTPTYEGKPT
jgi:tRNA (cytidine/uridine-2'-O-)-methyltransferase